ncbi:hypothetical protein [Bradyrhizobium sp.]|uniref:hypothetical protein n=1 Tax=Bradyrhizobium sp. TaxID=376 RepID=UPI003BB03857
MAFKKSIDGGHIAGFFQLIVRRIPGRIVDDGQELKDDFFPFERFAGRVVEMGASVLLNEL